MTPEEAARVLGVRHPGATPQDVRSAFRRHVRMVHPDGPGRTGTSLGVDPLLAARAALLHPSPGPPPAVAVVEVRRLRRWWAPWRTRARRRDLL